MMHGAPRWPALILLPALLIGIVLLDRRDEPDPGAVIDTRSAMPVAAGTSVLLDVAALTSQRSFAS